MPNHTRDLPGSGTIQSTLEDAIQSKRELTTIYTELTCRIGNPYPQQHLIVLLKEELEQIANLEDVYAKQRSRLVPRFAGRPVESAVVSQAAIAKIPTQDLLHDALMRVRLCRREYSKSAAIVQGAEFKRIFLFLAECARQHFSVLHAEHQMMRTYPTYVDFSVDPWGHS